MGEAAPDRGKITDAVVLAFSRSQLATVAGAHALRALVTNIYGEMTETGKLDLQVLWDKLQDQAGFSWDGGVPPVCAIKRWEQRLGIEVLLPPHLDIMSAGEIEQRAGECEIDPADERKLFASDAAPAAPAPEPAPAPVEPPAPAAHGWRAWLNRKEVGVAAVVLAVLLLGFAGYQLSGYFGSPEWREFPTAGIEGGIPIASAEKMGDQLGVRLSNDDWLSQPKAVIREQLVAGLRSLDGQGVQVLFVRDTSGTPRVSAQWFGDEIETRFIR